MSDDIEFPDEFPEGDDDSPQGGLVDHAKIKTLIEAARDALRPLGITLDPSNVQLSMHGGQTFIMLPGLVRAAALERANQDQDAKAKFNQMMAGQNQNRIAEERKRLEQLVDDPDALARALFEGEEAEDTSGCAHERRHPEGFCLDCGEGLEG